MKKKMLCFVLAIVVCLGMLAGCGADNADKKDDASQQEVQSDKTDDKTDDTADAEKGDADGGEITETVTLSGTYYSGQVMIMLELNPDGTISGEANGETLEGTWGESDEADIEAIGTAGSNEMKFLVTRESDGSYSATVDLVAGMVLTGK